MTQKIEVLSRGGLCGPYSIEIDGTAITDVVDYQLWQDEPTGVHHLTFTVLTNNFQIKKDPNVTYTDMRGKK